MNAIRIPRAGRLRRLRSRLAVVCLATFPLALTAGEAAPDANRVSRVLVRLRTTAEANARDPKTRKMGDALADLYVRDLAGFCIKEKVSVNEFLLALGVGLDSSDFLRRHPLTRGTFKNFGTDEERDRRKAVIGDPTLRKRPDWLLHFALSAALTAATNADTAELLGIAKEMQDALGDSGFSFADLAADDAGIAFASHLLAHPGRLADVAESFRGESFLPAVGDLEEGLSMQALTKKYGEPGGEQFRAACRALRLRMNEQAVYKTWTSQNQKALEKK
jgi:hypothetical protein